MKLYRLFKETEKGLFYSNKIFATKQIAESYRAKLDDCSLWIVEEFEDFFDEKMNFNIKGTGLYRTREGKRAFVNYKNNITERYVGVIEDVPRTITWDLEGCCWVNDMRLNSKFDIIAEG